MVTLEATPKATQILTIKFIENSWLSPNVKNSTADDLITVVLNRIRDDASQYDEFRDMFSDMEGMDLLLKKLPKIDCEEWAHRIITNIDILLIFIIFLIYISLKLYFFTAGSIYIYIPP